MTSAVIEDRVMQYHRHNDVLKTMKKTTKAEVWTTWLSEVESWEAKVNQQKKRLEELGVNIGKEA